MISSCFEASRGKLSNELQKTAATKDAEIQDLKAKLDATKLRRSSQSLRQSVRSRRSATN